MRFHTAVSIAATAAPVLLIDAGSAAASTTVARDAGATSIVAAVESNTSENAPLSPSSSSLARPKKSLFSNRMDRARRLARTTSSPAGMIDTGVLSSRNLAVPLPATEYYCPRDQCPASLCECADTGGDMTDCHAELADVCAAGAVGDCVYEGYVDVYEELYCPFVQCLGQTDDGGGGTLKICDCHFYESYCERLESVECLGAESAPGSTPFFGCDQTRLVDVCDRANKCGEEKDDEGDEGGSDEGAEAVEAEAEPEGAIGARVETPSISKIKGANAAGTRGTTAVAFGTVMATTVSFAALQFLGVFSL